MISLSHTICHDVEIISTPDHLYHAITSAEGLEKWWVLHAVGIPAIGEEYSLYFSPEYDWRAKVIDCEANKYIEWKLTVADEDWMDTKLAFTIIERENKCLLRFEHRAWKDTNDHFRRTSYCWGQYLRCLKEYIEESKVVSYMKRSGL